jgi:hypothetical protein
LEDAARNEADPANPYASGRFVAFHGAGGTVIRSLSPHFSLTTYHKTGASHAKPSLEFPRAVARQCCRAGRL